MRLTSYVLMAVRLGRDREKRIELTSTDRPTRKHRLYRDHAMHRGPGKWFRRRPVRNRVQPGNV